MGFAAAHPHMFIDSKVTVDMDNTTLKGLEVTWWFDPLFSSNILIDFDVNKNRILDAEEVGYIRDYAFGNLKQYDYFIYLQTGNSRYSPESTVNFNAYYEGETLVYHFYVPFNAAINGGQYTVAMYDKTYYCDIQYVRKDPVVLRGDTTATWELLTNTDMKIKYGGNVSVAREGKTYSGVAYPMQLVVEIPE